MEVPNSLIKHFTHHLIPEQIISYNGLEFKKSIVQELLAIHKIDIHLTTSQHPKSNRVIERFHFTLIEYI